MVNSGAVCVCVFIYFSEPLANHREKQKQKSALSLVASGHFNLPDTVRCSQMGNGYEFRARQGRNQAEEKGKSRIARIRNHFIERTEAGSRIATIPKVPALHWGRGQRG